MLTIDRMYYAPVKSLALGEVTRTRLEKPGIPGDRAFFIIDQDGKLVTQRDYGALVQVCPSYDASNGVLRLNFPDGLSIEGVPELGDVITAPFWEGRPVAGRFVLGEWSDALSEVCGAPVRLVKAEAAGSSFDAYPISMCSMASLDALAQAAGRESVDGRRFRQNIYLSGATPHQEDRWIGGEVRVGQALLLVKMPDERCAVTTHSPETGETDLNTLKIIASYRTDQPKQANFGVYCTVIEPGEAAVGDAVIPSESADRTATG